MQLTMVSAVPLSSGDALWATKVERSGESAMTTIPQNRRKPINKPSDPIRNAKGDKMQQVKGMRTSNPVLYK